MGAVLVGPLPTSDYGVAAGTGVNTAVGNGVATVVRFVVNTLETIMLNTTNNPMATKIPLATFNPRLDAGCVFFCGAFFAFAILESSSRLRHTL